MSSDEIKMEPYHVGDEGAILLLFKEVFGLSRSADFWSWQYVENPKGKSWIMLAKAKDEVIGHFALRRNHINFAGKEVVAGQACDSMIRSDSRSSGLFSQLVVENYQYAQKEGLQIAFSFPNRNSYPRHMALGRKRIAYLKSYYLRIGFKKVVGRVIDIGLKNILKIKFSIIKLYLRMRTPNNIKVIITTELPDCISPLLEEAQKYEVLSIWKDLDYMKWRYEKNPEFSYHFHLLKVDDHVEGLIVIRDCGDSITICEFMHKTKNLRQSIIFLNNIINYYVKKSAQKIVFSGFDNGFFDYVFNNCGFESYPSNLVFTAQAFNNDICPEVLSGPHNWTVVYGDTDVV